MGVASTSRRELAENGFDVLAAEQWGEALGLAEEAKPDFVLLDAVERPAEAGPSFYCWRLNQVPPGPIQLNPSPQVANVFPVFVTAISP
jgi:CheY-like chemotaxis protein